MDPNNQDNFGPPPAPGLDGNEFNPGSPEQPAPPPAPAQPVMPQTSAPAPQPMMQANPAPAPMMQRQPRPRMNTNSISDKIEQILIFVYFFVAALLLFRFVLNFFAASTASPFVNFVHQLTFPFMFPFDGMFGSVGVANSVIEFEVLVAILVYALVFFGLARLVRIIFR